MQCTHSVFYQVRHGRGNVKMDAPSLRELSQVIVENANALPAPTSAYAALTALAIVEALLLSARLLAVNEVCFPVARPTQCTLFI